MLGDAAIGSTSGVHPALKLVIHGFTTAERRHAVGARCLMTFKMVVPAFMLLVGLVGCSSSTPSERADERHQIDAAVNNVLPQLYRDVPGSQELARKARGVLVFPDVYKAAVGVGGEYGKGALRVGGAD